MALAASASAFFSDTFVEVDNVTEVYEAVDRNTTVTLKNSHFYVTLWYEPTGIKNHPGWDEFYRKLVNNVRDPEKQDDEVFEEKWGLGYYYVVGGEDMRRAGMMGAAEKCEYMLFTFSHDNNHDRHLHGWLLASQTQDILTENWERKFSLSPEDDFAYILENYIEIVALATARDDNLDDSYFYKQGADEKKHYYFGYMLVLLFEYFAISKLRKTHIVLESVPNAILFYKKLGYSFVNELISMYKDLPEEVNFDEGWFDVMQERVSRVASAALKLTNGNVQASALLTYSNLLRLKQN